MQHALQRMITGALAPAIGQAAVEMDWQLGHGFRDGADSS
jgi:hypothetical protein